MRQRLLLLSLLLFSLLTTACSMPFTQTTQSLSSGIIVILGLVPASATPSPEQMATASATLSQRLTAFGLTNAQVSQVTANNQPAIKVEVPHFGGDESGTLDKLLATGRLEFWSTGSTPLSINTTFDPTQFTQYNPGDRAAFTNSDLDPSKCSVGTDQVGRPQINFAMKGNSSTRFYTFTSENVNQYLTITLDRIVVESAVIQSAINGDVAITGSINAQQANAFVSVIKYPPLPVTLQKESETTF
jgi:preprotein translocase subunit SecD